MDAFWDMEYSKAGDLEKEIKEYCTKNNLPMPTIRQYARSWKLERILKEIKTEEYVNGINMHKSLLDY